MLTSLSPTSRRRINGCIAVIASGIALSLANPAAAQLPPITKPITIDRPGAYTLYRDVRVDSGDAITISASNVTLDLNGRAVTTQTAGSGRGIVVLNASSVRVKNGKIGSFNMNVMADGAVNLVAERLQITGANLPLAGGPAEIGFVLVNTRGADIGHNTVTHVGLGLIIRGGASGGNNIHDNTFVGGPDTSRSPLGVCWNPLAGAPATNPGPKGDRVYNNHISQFLSGLSFSAGTTGTIAKENTISFVNAAFTAVTLGNAANVLLDNTTVQVTP